MQTWNVEAPSLLFMHSFVGVGKEKRLSLSIMLDQGQDRFPFT